MAIYRNVSVSFWTDAKVEEFSTQERYLFLYLLTNPQTRLCGCYEITPHRMAADAGLPEQEVRELLRSLEQVRQVIRYQPDTHELLILHWYRYNWLRSPKLCRGVEKELPEIQYAPFRSYLRQRLWERYEKELDAETEAAETTEAAPEYGEKAAAETEIPEKGSAAEEAPEESGIFLRNAALERESERLWAALGEEKDDSPVLETKLPPKLQFLS